MRPLILLALCATAIAAQSSPPNPRQAALQRFLQHAAAQRVDSAFALLPQLRQFGFDHSTLGVNPQMAQLAGDVRFASFIAGKAEVAPPFVESTRIIHEWRGEAPHDQFGWIARTLGDVDGDRVADVVISAPALPPGSTRGKVYAYSGRTGRLLWHVVGDTGSVLGIGLEAAGDVNRDGVGDVIAGAVGLNRAYVFSGKDGAQLLVLRADSTTQQLGNSASGIGDVNADGYPDLAVGAAVGGANGRLIIGAPGAGVHRKGRILVYDGVQVTPTFTMDNDSTGVALGGMFVSILGDVDADGTADVYATDFNTNTGRAFVYSGRDGRIIRTFTGAAPGEGFGIGAAKAGDINRDGHADLVIGSWQFGGAAWSGGRVQVLSGKDGRVLQTLTGRIAGETLGFDAVGISDTDGDGRTDLLVTSAWSLVNGLRSGRVFVVAGR